MRSHPIFALAASLVLAAPAIAQDAPAAAPAPEEKAKIDRAGLIFSMFAQALRSDDIPDAEKDGLIACLYANTLEDVSKATGELLAQNPEIDASEPVNVYVVAAVACGAREAGAAAGDAAPAQSE
ncbi:hypothetical protein [Alteriqipengyuania sp. 357]